MPGIVLKKSRTQSLIERVGGEDFKMPEFQAFNGVNIRGKAKTSIHEFLNPNEYCVEKARCRRLNEATFRSPLNDYCWCSPNQNYARTRASH